MNMGKIRHWTIRVLSILLIGLYLLIFIGESISEGPPDPSKMSPSEIGLFIANFIMIIGLALSWKFSVHGPVIIFIGYILFCVIEGELAEGAFLMFPLVGLLFFIDGLIFQKEDSG